MFVGLDAAIAGGKVGRELSYGKFYARPFNELKSFARFIENIDFFVAV